MMRCPCVSLLFLIVFPSIIASSLATQCVSAFNNTRYRPSLDICRRKNCFVFRQEPPYIIIDNAMKTLDDEPFLCTDYFKKYSGVLKGAFFEMIREMKPLEDAYCVYAGSNCSFNGLLKFLTDSAKVNDEHRWIAGGMLFVLESRITNHTIPSTPLIEDEFRLVGPPVEGYTTLAEAARTIVRPFTPKAWGFILICVVAHLIVRTCIVFDYVQALPPVQYFDWKLFYERLFSIRNDHISEGKNEEDEVLRSRIALWMFIATMFVGVSLIFWEVAVAVQVYEARIEAPLENIDPKRFAILEDSTEEHLFKVITGRESGWKRTKSMPETYEVLADSRNKIDSSVAYKLIHRYEMRKTPERCDRLRPYEDVPSKLVATRSPPELSGAWFYSSKVPESDRIEINKAIAKLKERGRILEIVENLAGKELLDKCKLKTSRINWVLLGLLHVIITGIPSAALIIRIIWGKTRRRFIRKQGSKSEIAENTR